jgi:hypothetical protein
MKPDNTDKKAETAEGRTGQVHPAGAAFLFGLCAFLFLVPFVVFVFVGLSLAYGRPGR